MIKSEGGVFSVSGSVAEVCADLAIAILSVRDCLIDYTSKDLGEANASIASICADALSHDYVSNDKEGEK